MSSPYPQPDLEDSINVTEAHGRVLREAAAAAREKRIAGNGGEPISLWLLAVCGLAAVTAGGILGGAGNWFSYATIFRDGYVRTPPPGTADQGPEPTEALAAFMRRGARIYSVKCNGCHGPDAKGGPAYPTLVGSDWVIGDSDVLAMVIINGLQGPVSSGRDYGSIMPSQASGLSTEDLAGVMTYVRNNFGNSTGDVITVEMAAAAMEISSQREKLNLPMTADELAANHAKALPGEPLAPDTLVDPITLAPVGEQQP